MMPGGHLVTAGILGAAAYAVSGSLALAAGCLAGGFLIDGDHYLDYLIFEGQWRQPSPASFLRYYFLSRPRLLVLPLHSLELMSVLTIVALAVRQPLLNGYLLGAGMHLVFDIAVNGDYSLKHRFLFYFFSYRAALRFDARAMLDVRLAPGSGAHPFREFFRWRPLGERRRP